MRRRREEHDAAHRRRHVKGKRAHQRKQRGYAVSMREPFGNDDDADEHWVDPVDGSPTHQVSVRKGAAGSPALL